MIEERFKSRLTAVINSAIAAWFIILMSGSFASPAGATTDPTALVGEGGSFLSPVTNLLLNADTGLAPLNPSYSDGSIDTGIADFVGSGPGEFNADFVVSERPLTPAEIATAQSNGRTVAYVPFAATPVAIATLAVCNPNDLATDVETPSTFCHDIPLTPELVGDIFTHGLTSNSVQPNANLPAPLAGWNDSRLTQADGVTGIPDGNGIGMASSLGPSAESYALMSLLDSDPVAKEDLDNALNNPANSPSTTSDAPSETWPFHSVHAYVGGDQGLLNKELTIDATTNAPGALASWGGLGGVDGGAHDAFAISSVWTGAPLGTPWNIPTAAIQNAAGKFVGTTESAAAASESDAALDPTTNLVTFDPSTTDDNAYNSSLMVESYLVVPTSGLTAEKATKLAQFIRFILGPKGQSDISVLGAAPATPAMVTAGLNVSAELNAEALVNASSSTTSTTTASPSSTVTTVSGSAATTVPGASGAANSTSSPAASGGEEGGAGGSGGSSSGLAFTGLSNPLPTLGVGAALALTGAYFRRRYRRRTARP